MEELKNQIKIAVDALKNQRVNEAEKLTKKLISKNPNIVFLYNLLGLILEQQEKFDEAHESYEKGLEIDPNFAMIYNNLGLLYSNQKNDNVKAEEYYRKSIALNQKIPEPYNNLASLYKALDKYDEAIKYYNKAIEINPKFVHAYHNLGNIYMALGKFKEAKIKFMKVIEIDPNYSISHRALSRLINYDDMDQHFLQLKKLYEKINLQNESINTLNKINLAFALGKAYEDIKDFDKSFEFYKEANALHYKKTNFSINDVKSQFNKIKKSFNENLYKKYNKLNTIDSSPIFILGMPRSGTTLIEQILSSHPDVFGADEQILIPNIIHQNFVNKDMNFNFDNIMYLDEEKLKDMGKIYISSMNKLSNNSKRYTDKYPENFFWIGFIKLILPKAKIIHCYRNSADNCLSLFKNHFPSKRMDYTYDLNQTIEYYNLYYHLMIYWNKILPNFVFNLKYENIISNTESEIRKLLKFCDLTWNYKCLNFHQNERIVKTASDVQTRKKIYSTSINSWKKYEKFLKDKFSKLVS